MNDKNKIYNLQQLKSLFVKLDFSWIKEVEIVTSKIPKDWRFVGGCVRDSLLGIKTYDIDISTLAKPDEIEDVLKDHFTLNVIGKRFGTIGVYYKGWSIEITTTRKDVENHGRYAEVEFNNVTFYEDSARRDFTINALMMNKSLEIYDYHNGITDLKDGKVCFVGNAQDRIQEDYLRILRYIRFFVRFSSESCDYEIIQQNLHGLRHLSKERIIKEMEGMCKNRNTNRAFEIMNHTGMSKFLFNNNLRSKIDDSMNVIQKMAYGLYDISIDKWPINKDVRGIHTLRVPSSLTIPEYTAYIWSKYKNLKLLNELENLLKYSGLQPVIVNFEKIDLSICEQFDGKDRGMAELLVRYYFIVQESYDYKKINENKLDFFNKITKSIRNN